MATLDWDLVLELAEGHRVLGVMAARLKETGFAGFPREHAKSCKAACARSISSA